MTWGRPVGWLLVPCSNRSKGASLTLITAASSSSSSSVLDRRHLKVKLRVLKFYKVDDSGKVQRLRKVCPQCGPGIFMATHFNRVYCGKCHLTYVYDKEGQTA